MGLDSCSQEMECDAAKLSKNPSNVSSRFANVCQFRSIGVFASGDQSNEGEKVGNLDNSGLFDAISAVKVAYVKFQEAHIPYDHHKLVAADKLMVSQLDLLCKIKRCFKEKQGNDALLLAEIQAREHLLVKLKCQAKTKDSNVVNLRRELEDLELRNKMLAEECRQREKLSVKTLNRHSFEEIVKAVGVGIHDFAKPLIALMKASGWDLDQAANAIEDSVVYARRSHKKYAFEAYISRKMLSGFSSQLCDTERIMQFDDPIDALVEDPRSDFATFCRKKYLALVHPSMETSFFGNVDHRIFVANGLHPNTLFYRAFAKMARWVWLLQGAIASSSTEVEIFAVKHGAVFSDLYMERIEDFKEDDASISGQGGRKYKVELMIFPRFKVGNLLIKSRVYCSKMAVLDGTSYIGKTMIS